MLGHQILGELLQNSNWVFAAGGRERNAGRAAVTLWYSVAQW